MNQTIEAEEKKNEDDGGYYAIKGFLYQFDVTISEVLNYPDQDIKFEQVQDINYEDYVIQVKHKETQVYQPNKIRKPIIQLLNIFENNQQQKICLYCHFKDCKPQEKKLSLEELEQILGPQKNNFNQLLKENFTRNFILRFSEDYESQFDKLIVLIMEKYNLKSKEMAVLYHSIIRSRLLDLAIKDRNLRVINKAILDDFIKNREKVVFYESYKKYIKKEQFYQMMKKEFFGHKGINILPFERLFIIDVSHQDNFVDLLETIGTISSKYYKQDKSPAPYICFRNIDFQLLNEIKRHLVDKNITFTDGTCFNGDRFRIDKLIAPSTKENNIIIKFVNEENIPDLFNNTKIEEVYEFFRDSKFETETNCKHIQIHIEEIKEVIKMIR
jgi:hypothetical protein